MWIFKYYEAKLLIHKANIEFKLFSILRNKARKDVDKALASIKEYLGERLI